MIRSSGRLSRDDAFTRYSKYESTPAPGINNIKPFIIIFVRKLISFVFYFIKSKVNALFTKTVKLRVRNENTKL